MRAALALGDNLDAEVCDLLDFCHPWIKKIYQFGYTVATQDYPRIWQILFYAAKNRSIQRFTIWLNRFLFRSFQGCLRQKKPDILILTHFFPAHLIKEAKDTLKFKVICVITDFRVHPFWLAEPVDYYFTALEESGFELTAKGISPEKIITGFVPLRKDFFKPQDKEALRRKFNLNEKPALLFVSSSRGDFPFLKKALSRLVKGFNLFVIYGNNNSLKKYLDKASRNNLKCFRSYDQIWELMSLACAIVTKPGGLTVFEGVTLRKPFIFTHYIPGQEKENMDFLVAKGVARQVFSSQKLVEAAFYFSGSRERFVERYPVIFKDMAPAIGRLIESFKNA